MSQTTRFALIALFLAVLSGLGAPYYLLDLAGRVRSPYHGYFRSSGWVGQSLGILALASFLFLWLYPLRKRVRRFHGRGPIATWLRIHIMVGFFMPWLVALHAGWRFTGLAGLAFWALLVVWASGIVGRYIYSRIPRSQSGIELSMDEVATRRRELVLKISAHTGLAPAEIEQLTQGSLAPGTNLGVGASFRRMIADDLALRRSLRDLRRRWKQASPGAAAPEPGNWSEVARLARQEMALAQQVRMLEATRRVFRYWHAAHLPVGLTALLAVIVHVVVVIAMGATWFR